MTFEHGTAEKQGNPKDRAGRSKVALSNVPLQVLMEVALAMTEGSWKYGRHNYRISDVYASVYFDAAMRHMFAWFEGEDTDPDSGLSHVTKAIATLTVLQDALMNGKVIDDRPPRPADPISDANTVSQRMQDKLRDMHGDPVGPYTEEYYGS